MRRNLPGFRSLVDAARLVLCGGCGTDARSACPTVELPVKQPQTSPSFLHSQFPASTARTKVC